VFSVVKEQLQITMAEAVARQREIPVAGPLLGVRGIALIMPPSINYQLPILSTLHPSPFIIPTAHSGPVA
jgi:hypothetical protein